jgi:hypothetical protein
VDTVPIPGSRYVPGIADRRVADGLDPDASAVDNKDKPIGQRDLLPM